MTTHHSTARYRYPGLLASLLSGLLLSPLANAALYITIVQGLGGMPEYAERFETQRQQISTVSRAMSNEETLHIFHTEEANREQLLAHFTTLSQTMSEEDRLLLYLIGHGSFDGENYKFNIPGPDIDTTDLSEALDSLPGGPHVLINTSSSSGALLEPLADSQHILVTATRNGNERNATEFGAWLARGLVNEEADLDKDGLISVQEAFDFAERQVADFYTSADRLATEHPQLQGEGAARFNIARLGELAVASDNDELNALLEQRLSIDEQIEALQLRRSELDAAQYTQQLRALILESATLSEQIDSLSEADNAADEE